MTRTYSILYIHIYTVHTFIYILYIRIRVHYVMCVLPLTFLCVMLHWHCVCDAGNGVAVSVNDIIIKLVATILKVSTVIHTACKHIIGTVY